MKTFEQVWETLPGNGWLSKEEAELLWRVVNEIDGAILEVGCYRGRSTVLLASTGRRVHSVDPFDGFNTEMTGDQVEADWRENMDSRDLRVQLHRIRVEEWNARQCKFAYLDGDHTYQGTVDQISKAIECGAQIIAIHDVTDDGDGYHIKRAAFEMLGRWDERVGCLAVWRCL